MKPFLVAAAAITTLCAPLAAFGDGSLVVFRAWSRPAVAGSSGIGYMVVANHRRTTEILEKVESPIAARVEMHSSSMAGGVMSMKKEERVAVPPGGQVTFGPGGYHLMFVGLTKTLSAGEMAPATLIFASGARIVVQFKVSAGAGPPDMDAMNH